MSGPRFSGRVALMIVALLVALPLHGLWRLVRAPSPWPRLLLGAVARIVGARVSVVGAPRRRGVVFLANHQSWIDTPLLGGATGCAFVAKADMRAVPLVGWLCTLNRTIFVRREDRFAVATQIEALRAALTEARSTPGAVAIFPEGTTGDGVRLLPFKPALLAALDPPPAGVVIQPVRIDYGGAARDLVWIEGESGLAHARRVLGRRGSFVATLRFLEPFDPALHPGRKAIAAEARARIEAAPDPPRRGGPTNRWRVPANGPPPARPPPRAGAELLCAVHDTRPHDLPRQVVRLPDERL